MSMIIKDRIKALKLGYPTVSDKYNVAGGMAGNAPIEVGRLVKYTSVPGIYEEAVGMADIAELAGVALAVNVKLNPIWPQDGAFPITIQPNEAFDVFVDGFIAVELDPTVSTETTLAVPAVGVLTTDQAIIPDKPYYTRAADGGGAGYLNDGTNKYTLVANPTQGDLGLYYELTNLGKDASTDVVTPNKQVAVILATGGITTIDAVAGGIVAVPGAYFTGFKEGRLAEIRLSR